MGIIFVLAFIAPQFILVGLVSARRDGVSVLSREFWVAS